MEKESEIEKLEKQLEEAKEKILHAKGLGKTKKSRKKHILIIVLSVIGVFILWYLYAIGVFYVPQTYEIPENVPFNIIETEWNNCYIYEGEGLQCRLDIKVNVPQVQENIGRVYTLYNDYAPTWRNGFINKTYTYIAFDSTGDKKIELYDINPGLYEDESSMVFCWVSQDFWPENEGDRGEFKCTEQLIDNPKFDLEFSPAYSSVYVSGYDSESFSLNIWNKGNIEVCPDFVYDNNEYKPSIYIKTDNECIGAGESSTYVGTVYGRNSDGQTNHYLKVYPTSNERYYAEDLNQYGGFGSKDYTIEVNSVSVE